MEQNKKWCPFVAFYDMRAATFVLPDEIADVSIAGLQWFILVPRLNHTGSHIDSQSKPYLHREINPTIWGESNCSSLVLLASYDMPYKKAEVQFYIKKKKKTGTPWGLSSEKKLK